MGKKPANNDVQFWRDSDLPGVEVRYSSYCEDTFRKHTHAAYSIGLIEAGGTSFFLEGENYYAKAGQIALIQPGAVHACNPDPESGWTYRMFYVDESWLTSVANEVFGRETVPPYFPSPVVENSELYNVWLALHMAIIDGSDLLEKETLLVHGLAQLISHHAEQGEVHQPAEDDCAVLLVKEYLAANVSEKVSLEALSEVAHLSRYHLLRVFQGAVGLPPHAYQNQLRVDLSKGLLAQGVPISRAAAEVGFVDQSHFSRVFKQYTGATPRQYQTALSSDE